MVEVPGGGIVKAGSVVSSTKDQVVAIIIATIIIIIITIMTVINHHDYLGHNRVDNLTPQFSVDITALVEIIVTPAFTVNSSIRLTLLSRKQMELTKDAKSHIHLDYGSLTR